MDDGKSGAGSGQPAPAESPGTGREGLCYRLAVRRNGKSGDRRAPGVAMAWATLGMAALAFAQPILDLLGGNATFFVARRLTPVEIGGLAVGLLAVPLPVIILLALLRRRRPGLTARLGELVLGLLVALVALQAVHGWRSDAAALTLALATGLAAAVGLRRSQAARQLVRLLGFATLVVPLAFLLRPPVRQLLSRTGGEVAVHASGGRAPIVFVVFDELAAVSLLAADGRLDAERFPGFAALAARSTRYANALAASDTTEYAVPALLTGTLPRQGELPTAEEHPRSLFTAFGGDYRIVAFEDVTQLCPPILNQAGEPVRSKLARWTDLGRDLAVIWAHLTLPHTWRSRLPSLEARWAGFGRGAVAGGAAARAEGEPAEDRPARFRHFLAALRAEPRRSLFFHHNNLPHWPWEYLPSGRRYASPPDRIPGLVKEVWQRDEAITAQAMQRYLLQLQLVDGLVGELLRRLDELGILDEALLVVTADHGVSFRPGDARRLYTESNRADVLGVPLFVKAPGQRYGEVVDAPVSALDVLPTLFDLLGVPAPWATEGVSMLRPRARGPRPVFAKHRGRLEVGLEVDGEKQAMLRRQSELFGGLDRIEYSGTRPELFGRAIASLEVTGERLSPGLRVDGEQLYRHLDPSSPTSLAWLSGTLGSEGSEAAELVIGVNGRVAASTRAWRSEDGTWQFSALLPEESLAAGENDIELLAADEGGRRFRRLVAEHLEPRRLIGTGERRTLVGGSRRWPLVEAAVEGWFSVDEAEGTVVVAGWAWGRRSGEPPFEIVLLLGGEEVYSGSTNRTDPPVAAELGIPATSRCGFRFELPPGALPGLRRKGLRAVATAAEGTASELGVFYRLEAVAGGEEIRVSNGRVIPVRGDLVGGWLDRIETQPGGEILLEGWAASPPAGGVAEQLATFADGRCIHLGTVGLQRPDVAAHLGRPDLLASGFRLTVAPPPGNQAPRIFAVFPDNSAAELRLWQPAGGT